MRKIEEAMIEAVKARQPWKQANTQVTVASALDHDLIRVYLHGNLICELHVYPSWFLVRFDHCEWLTNTTKSRINALAEHLGFPRIRQIDGKWYWQNHPCGGLKSRPFDHRKDWMRVTAKALPEEVAA
jgi:hypothetical protein